MKTRIQAAAIKEKVRARVKIRASENVRVSARVRVTVGKSTSKSRSVSVICAMFSIMRHGHHSLFDNNELFIIHYFKIIITSTSNLISLPLAG